MNMAWKANRASTFAVRAFGYLVRNPEVHVGGAGYVLPLLPDR